MDNNKIPDPRASVCSCIEQQGDNVGGACDGDCSGLDQGDIDFPIGSCLAYSIVAPTLFCTDVESIVRRRAELSFY